MNWLHDVMTEVASHPAGDECKTTMLVLATDLSEICDRFVQKAPAPAVSFDAETGDLRVGWEREDKVLRLSLSADDGSLDLDLSHGEVTRIVIRPNYAVLKSAVRSFFDKWA